VLATVVGQRPQMSPRVSKVIVMYVVLTKRAEQNAANILCMSTS